MPDPDLAIRGGGGGGGGAQFGLQIRGAPRAPPLDPPLRWM